MGQTVSRKANSCRASGAVGKNPVVYRIFRKMFNPETAKDMRVLDFGAGKKPIHTQVLVAEGYDVDAFDLPENMTPEHNKSAMIELYDVVLLSNVLNVQDGEREIQEVLSQVAEVLRSGAHVIANFPASPRYSHMLNDQLADILREFFQVVIPQEGREAGRGAVVFYMTNAFRR